MKNDAIFSIINLKMPYSFLRLFFYLPSVMILKKRNEKENISWKNTILRDNLFLNLLNIMKGYAYILTHLGLIYKKKLERKKNSKIWY